MKSTVFSAVVVSIGYALLGWDFAALLGIFFLCSIDCNYTLITSIRDLNYLTIVLTLIFII
jgi:hypothetical protein